MAVAKELENVTVGEILLEDFLDPAGITQAAFAEAIGLPPSRVNEIVKGKKRLTASYALRFARFWGNSAEFWLNLQTHCDLHNAKAEEPIVRREVPTLAQYSRRARRKRSAKTPA